MTQQFQEVRCRGAVLLAGLLLMGTVALPARAEEKKTQTSLQLVPANAAFYSSMLHNREQLRAITHSRAWAKLMDLPLVKQGLNKLQEQYKSDQAAPFRQMLEDPDNQELLALLGEAAGDEIFFYGTASWGDFASLIAVVNSANQFGPLMLIATGRGEISKYNELRGKAILQALAEHTDLIKIPDLVIGFKLPDAKKANNQLKRLENLANAVAENAPQLKERFKRVKVGDGSFLTLTLDGSLVPWDKIPLKDSEDKEGEFDKLIKTLSNLKLTVSLGVSGNYLLLGLGHSTAPLAGLGGKGEKLGDRPELKVLSRYADRKLTSVGYVSKALRSHGATSAKDLDSLVEKAKELLENAPLLNDKEKMKLVRDLGEIIGDMKKTLPEFGALVGLSFPTATGSEAYSYDFSHFKGVKNPRPLTLLDHLGGAPLLAVVGSGGESGSGYQTFAKWARLLYQNLNEIALTRLDGDPKEKYLQVRDMVVPLFQRFDEITGKMFLPSLDGQVGFVLDAKWTSRQWHKSFPETEHGLPMPELGFLLGLKDAALFQKALGEYRRLIDDTIGVARELVPGGGIPEIKFPAPKVVKKASGTLYTYPLPEEAGLDVRVMPAAGVGEKVFAFTFSLGHAERLLASKPLDVKGTALADPAHPLVLAVVFNWTGLIDAATPWIEMGVAKAATNLPGDGEKPSPEELVKQVRTVLEVLKVYKGTTSAIYVAEGTVVTHSVSVVRDLPK